MATQTAMRRVTSVLGRAFPDGEVEAYAYPGGPLVPNVSVTSGVLRIVSARAEALGLAAFSKLKTFANGAVVVAANASVDHAFLVRSGCVRVTRVAADGTRSLVSILRAGELFGDPLRPDAGPVRQRAVASGETEVWLLDARDVRERIRTHPEVAERLLDCYAERAQKLRLQMHALTSKDVATRLAETVLATAGAGGQGCSHGCASELQGVTEQDLADLVAAPRSLVAMRLADMKRRGVLVQHGRALCVRDLAELQRMTVS